MSVIDRYEKFLDKTQQQLVLFFDKEMHYGSGFDRQSPPHHFLKNSIVLGLMVFLAIRGLLLIVAWGLSGFFGVVIQ